MIVDNSLLQYKFGFNEKEGDTIQSLIDIFVEKYSKTTYDLASMILVKNGAFLFIIKNIYGSLEGSVLTHNLNTIVSNHLPS